VTAILVLLVVGCQQPAPAQIAIPAAPSGAAADFSLPPPASPAPATQRMIWSTAYIAYLANESSGADAVALTDMSGHRLGPQLPHADWCHAAMEGTVSVHQPDAGFRTFNFAGQSTAAATDCRDVFPHVGAGVLEGTNRATFAAVPPDAPYGLGVATFRLVPWRSIAVDATVFPVPTVLFIPSLRGTHFTLPDGRQMQHDGYVMAVDKGGAIRGVHIDFFKGPTRDDTPPAGLASDEGHRIAAFVITDEAVIGQLRQLHQRS
jgi:3D (Asp-Asp-Asp) domain-containing protein